MTVITQIVPETELRMVVDVLIIIMIMVLLNVQNVVVNVQNVLKMDVFHAQESEILLHELAPTDNCPCDGGYYDNGLNNAEC
jgi:hypothetical protein